MQGMFVLRNFSSRKVFTWFLIDWLVRTVKHEVLKDSDVTLCTSVLLQLVSPPPFSALAGLHLVFRCHALRSWSSLYVYYLVPGPLVVFSLAGCSCCTSQQSGNLGVFLIFVSVNGMYK